MLPANRQKFKKELQKEIEESEREHHEQTEEELLYIKSYMYDMEGYDYELDWQEELAEESEVWDDEKEFDFDDDFWGRFDDDPYLPYDGDGWLDLDEDM